LGGNPHREATWSGKRPPKTMAPSTKTVTALEASATFGSRLGGQGGWGGQGVGVGWANPRDRRLWPARPAAPQPPSRCALRGAAAPPECVAQPGAGNARPSRRQGSALCHRRAGALNLRPHGLSSSLFMEAPPVCIYIYIHTGDHQRHSTAEPGVAQVWWRASAPATTTLAEARGPVPRPLLGPWAV
jgi:hypothetical protein